MGPCQAYLAQLIPISLRTLSIATKRDNVIKNKLHEYLRSKKTTASLTEAPGDEEEEEGLTIDEFIELFKLVFNTC